MHNRAEEKTMRTLSTHWMSGALVALFALSLGFGGMAEAAEGGQHGGGGHGGGGGGGHRGGGAYRGGGYHRGGPGWGGGYYGEPPVVVAAPYVCIPPLIYSPYVPPC